MACSITLPFWPGALDCVDWSLDNHLVVVGGENVAILVPRLHALEPPYWDTVLVQVNAFLLSELPHRDPLPDHAFSLGEEIAVRQAQAAKWSPPGLARFGGCALAVHTTNHVLSLWTPQGNARASKNWKRTLIINHAVQEYYNRHTEHVADSVEQIQARQRILAFAWGPPLHSGEERQNSHLFHGNHFLAVSTAANDILLLSIDSPHSDRLDRSDEWKATVADRIKVGSYVSHLAWSAWRFDETRGNSNSDLAYVVTQVHRSTSTSSTSFQDHRLVATTVLGTNSGSVKSSNTSKQLLDRSDVTGPLRFEQEKFIAFCSNLVFCVGPADKPLSHHLDDRWDAISGVTIIEDTIHFASQMSAATAATASLRVSMETDALTSQSNAQWKDEIIEQKTAYSAKHDLQGQVQERTWGIAASPVSGYVATCVTMHPADSVAYIIGNDQVTTLSVTLETAGATTPLPSRSPLVPMDTTYFYLRQLQQVPQDLKRYRSLQPSAPVSSTEYLLYRLRIMLYSTEVLENQVKNIANMLQGKSAHTSESIRFIVRHVPKPFLNFPAVGLQLDTQSFDICKIYDIALSKVESEHTLGSIISSAVDWTETCKICQQPITFESFKWARCTNGHKYSRCALSLLSIQEPGSTKQCGICGLQYLDETNSSDDHLNIAKTGGVDQAAIPANNMWVKISPSGSTTARTTTTLAQLLFAACDVCIYCGGRFTD